jgi:hypothetical protein
MTRRAFLTLLLALCLLVMLMTSIGYQNRRSIYRKYLWLRLDASTDKGLLSAEQFQFIKAL